MKTKKFERFDIPEMQNSWILSYADIVTILLCFFMLYFNFDKVKTPLNVIADEEFNKATKDVATVLGMEMGTLLSAFKDIPAVDLLSYKQHVMIEFPKGDFFPRGFASVKREKIKEIQDIVEKLKPFNEKIQITIIGYTDPTPVRPTHDRWWKTNDELSAARALSLLRFFQAGGFKTGSVFIGGQGIKSLKETPRDLLTGNERRDDIKLENYRTFSLRVEPIQ